ncbi:MULTISPECIES: rhodanese-like domain-containing protein [unclassified Agarivorans]|uniref:rhodanese-like domain-containing protein n=1 Tax=unclassified Agarivorans TaxID=2636026 RepID=UPI0026E458EA|nr:MULTISPECIES: rhodanese-like domain-containing protein [unclassified Agarivorans]MDO6686756.1 rhodanese-like domain-containing protein [Agarivorans sp. 3_MG-2023]MDO6716514.1 rhodanese-like domain-containing protein [Agarivorans sp. 2_MG-2023]
MKMIRILSCLWLCSIFSITGAQATERADTAWQNVLKQQALLIDVRTEGEFSQGHIEQAYNIPHTAIAEQIASVTKDKNQPIVVYCRSGNRSGYALQVLQAMGYQQVVNGGGLDEMLAAKSE